MSLLNPLKPYVLRNEPIKGRIWDRLPLTRESNFTLLNPMTPVNECWLQTLCHSSLSTYVYYGLVFSSFSCLVRRFHRLGSLLSVAHFIALFFRQLDCHSSLSLSPFSLFFFSFTLHSPDRRLFLSTAVTTVFSSIYSGATRTLKTERLPWALLFAWEFLPLTISRYN